MIHEFGIFLLKRGQWAWGPWRRPGSADVSSLEQTLRSWVELWPNLTVCIRKRYSDQKTLFPVSTQDTERNLKMKTKVHKLRLRDKKNDSVKKQMCLFWYDFSNIMCGLFSPDNSSVDVWDFMDLYIFCQKRECSTSHLLLKSLKCFYGFSMYHL